MQTNVERVDNNLSHLYPVFAELLAKCVAEATIESRDKFNNFSHWYIFEGYRSADRQMWLYNNHKTKVKLPDHHGYGLAGDVVWMDDKGNPHWDEPEGLYDVLGHNARAVRLEWGGDWSPARRDVYHIQCTDAQLKIWKPEAIAYIHGEGLTTP